ncbi:MAG: hypothetical protein QM811_20505 [Pirellulales bacterium]
MRFYEALPSPALCLEIAAFFAVAGLLVTNPSLVGDDSGMGSWLGALFVVVSVAALSKPLARGTKLERAGAFVVMSPLGYVLWELVRRTF